MVAAECDFYSRGEKKKVSFTAFAYLGWEEADTSHLTAGGNHPFVSDPLKPCDTRQQHKQVCSAPLAYQIAASQKSHPPKSLFPFFFWQRKHSYNQLRILKWLLSLFAFELWIDFDHIVD